MAGTWGISADLSKISDHQQNLIINEIQNYRRLNPIKRAGLYELRPAAEGVATAGATFYEARRKTAAILLYRWDQKGALAQHIDITKLRLSSSYQVTDIDTGLRYAVSGEDLLRDGVTVQFGAERLSALVFIEPLK
jgi:alpha-galactosidase